MTSVLAALIGLALCRAAMCDEPDPMKLLCDCREACKEIKDYTGTFTKREFLRGELRDTEVMFLKFRQEPLSIYAKWIGEAHKGREAIYVKGKNKDRVVGHEYIGPLNVSVAMDVHGREARKNARSPITEGGMINSIRTFIRYVEMGKQNRDGRLRYLGSETFDGRQVHVILRILDERPDYPAYLTFLYIEKERLLPVKSVGYDWDHKLLWLYTTVDLKLNVGLSDKDFDPDNDGYNYPGLPKLPLPKRF
ncbi:MAG: DUF1571 domain-containing protein [Planctomycetota bacterium]